MSVPHIHPSSSIGPDVTVAADARIGPNCYIDGRMRIGSKTTVVGGVTLVGDAEIGDDCLIEPGVTMTSVPAPTAAAKDPLVVGSGTRVGAGSILARGVTIGTNVRIEVGAFVSRNVPSHAIVSGNPAAIVGYDAPRSPDAKEPFIDSKTVRASSVEGVRLYRYPMICDARGDLTVAEYTPDFPFVPKRHFVVFNVPGAANRGEHAHWETQELLICLQGSVVVVADDGTTREEIELSDPTVGLLLEPMVWRVQYRYSPECILLVLASTHYDRADYIFDYDRFLQERRRRA